MYMYEVSQMAFFSEPDQTEKVAPSELLAPFCRDSFEHGGARQEKYCRAVSDEGILVGPSRVVHVLPG